MAQQLILPMIPFGATEINNHVSAWRGEDRWTYFLGAHPIYSHHANDDRMFRLITSMLIDSGACRQVEIIRTFGVSKSNIDRSLRMLRAGGPESFFKPTHKGRRGGGKVLNRETLENAQRLFKQGYSRSETADDLGVSYDTLRKAISDGRLTEPGKQHEIATTKSSRDVVDAQAASGMGTACIRVAERAFAAFGVCDGAPVRFEPCLDVPNGGVLCALPSLLMNGLLEGRRAIAQRGQGILQVFPYSVIACLHGLVSYQDG